MATLLLAAAVQKGEQGGQEGRGMHAPGSICAVLAVEQADTLAGRGHGQVSSRQPLPPSLPRGAGQRTRQARIRARRRAREAWERRGLCRGGVVGLQLFESWGAGRPTKLNLYTPGHPGPHPRSSTSS